MTGRPDRGLFVRNSDYCATHFMRPVGFSICLGTRVQDRIVETSMPLVKLVGMNRSPFSTFLVSSAFVIAISPSSTVGRLSGQTLVASLVGSSAVASHTKRPSAQSSRPASFAARMRRSP